MTVRKRSLRPRRDPARRTPEQDALRMLARRPLTVAELRERLIERGHDSRSIDAVVGELRESGSLDDAKLALHYIITRSDRLGHGPRRLIAELERRGVETGVAERAWRRAVEEGDVCPRTLLARETERRLRAAGGALDERLFSRVYNALLRAGFEPDSVRVALETYRGSPDDDPGRVVDEQRP